MNTGTTAADYKDLERCSERMTLLMGFNSVVLKSLSATASIPNISFTLEGLREVNILGTSD